MRLISTRIGIAFTFAFLIVCAGPAISLVRRNGDLRNLGLDKYLSSPRHFDMCISLVPCHSVERSRLVISHKQIFLLSKTKCSTFGPILNLVTDTVITDNH